MTAGFWALGMMTGTALDGFVDAALLRTDGRAILELGPWRLHPYAPSLKPLIAQAVADARAWGFKGPEPESFTAAERALTLAHAEAVQALLEQAGMEPGAVAVLGFHGQTVLHRGAKAGVRGATRQLGDGALLARRTGIDTAFDFRSADVAAGGHGAPLAPLYHAALMRFSGLAAPAAALNLGGVANVTWWGGAEDLAAFDVGPANGPLNEWLERCGLGPFDRDGALASQGRVQEAVIAAAMAHPYFAEPYPKSLDRYDFSADLVEGLSQADGAATLSALVGAGLARGLDLLPQRPRRVVVCGGGRKNPVLMREIAVRAQVEAIPAEAAGWRGDAIEAEAFAYLAARRLLDLPISFPATTGAPAPMPGGRLVRVSFRREPADAR
jgi:anhydro-N-acetylmuramic acid kinase